MQKNQSETPKLRRGRRSHMPSALDSHEQHSMASTVRAARTLRADHRTLMASTIDSSFSDNFSARRRIGISHRTSIMPTQEIPEGSKASDVESNEAELSRLYDEYLQKNMAAVIINKKTQERADLYMALLATTAKEYDHDEEKLFNLRTTERDLKNLIIAQNKVDAQMMDVNNCTKTEEIQSLKDILSQLYSLLQPLDVLCCNNMILPETAEEWKDAEQGLKECAETLKSIMELIGSKLDSYRNIHNGIKDFIKTYNEIEDRRERLTKSLCQLQVLILKTASRCLTPNDELSDSKIDSQQ